MNTFPKSALVALLLAFFAFGMSALISRTVFERLPHLEDEVAYLFQARSYAGGNLVIETPQPRRAYWQPFVVDHDGLRFGKYTPGWSLQLAVGILTGQAWIINAFLAALTVALAYRLGREIFNADVGVIAAALTAFSPMALLLNGTLMAHTSALFAATLFLYAYWRIERGKQTLRWGLLAGLGLGLLAANRPMTAIAIAAPLILWSGLRLARSLSAERMRGFATTLTPLIALSAITILLAAIVPINNYLATGSPTKDLYTLVWSYDRVGYGECCGRSGHTLEKGIRQARFDLSLTAADLFGWQIGSLTQDDGTLKPEVQAHLLNEGNYWEAIGISWILLPFAFIAAYRSKAIFVGLWLAAALGWVIFALHFQNGAQLTNPTFAWLWIITALAWLYLPLVFWRDHKHVWTWILWSAAIGLVVIQMAYWIGSQRYSTRYYFEGLTAIAILSAIPVAWLARRFSRPVVYGVLGLALAYSLYFYSTPRITALYRYNFISPEQIEAVNARRTTDQPVLVLVNGTGVRWRATGTLMAVTSPYLDSDIVLAWNYEGSDGEVKQQILDSFPDREVIEMNATDNYWWFPDEPPPPEVADL